MALTPNSSQQGLLTRLIAAIYNIVDHLVPVIQAIETAPSRPWQQRTRLAARFFSLIRDLLALTIRIGPNSVSPNPIFPAQPTAARPHATSPTRTPRRAAAPTPSSTPTSPALLSPRQLAQRLALILHLLECLAAEAAAAFPARLRHHIAKARTIAGCHALPNQTWERAG